MCKESIKETEINLVLFWRRGLSLKRNIFIYYDKYFLAYFENIYRTVQKF